MNNYHIKGRTDTLLQEYMIGLQEPPRTKVYETVLFLGRGLLVLDYYTLLGCLYATYH